MLTPALRRSAPRELMTRVPLAWPFRRLFKRLLMGLMLALWMGLGSPSSAHARTPQGAPRVLILPFSAPPELQTLAVRLTRVATQAIRDQVKLLEPSPPTLEKITPDCLFVTACADALMTDYAVGALLHARVEPGSSPSASPRVLVTLLAPDWPVSYIERGSSPEDMALVAAAREVLMIGLGKALPTLSPEELAALEATPPPPVDAAGSLAASIESGTSAPPEEEEPRQGWLGLKKSKRDAPSQPPGATGGAGTTSGAPASEDQTADVPESEPLDKDAPLPVVKTDRLSEGVKASGASRGTGGSRAAAKKKAGKPRRPPLTWPGLRPTGDWNGFALELNLVGATGALATHLNSQVAVGADNAVSDRYRWVQREDTPGGGVQLAFGWSLKPWLELGAEGTMLTGRQDLEIATYYAIAGLNDVSYTWTQYEPHFTAGLRARALSPAFRTLKLFAGLGVQAWLLPGYDEIEQGIGPHEPFGPYVRLGIEPQVGVRVLLASRVYLNLEGRILIDPGEALFDVVEAQNTGIELRELNDPSSAVRASNVLSVRAGVGGLF